MTAGVKPGRPSGLGAYHDTFIPSGETKRTSVRFAAPACGGHPIARGLPTFGTATDGPWPETGTIGWNGTPTGEMRAAAGRPPACWMPLGAPAPAAALA